MSEKKSRKMAGAFCARQADSKPNLLSLQCGSSSDCQKHNARIKSKQSASCRQFAICNRVSGCRLGSYVTKSGVLPPRRKEGIELPMHRAAES